MQVPCFAENGHYIGFGADQFCQVHVVFGFFIWIQILLLGNALPSIDPGTLFPSRGAAHFLIKDFWKPYPYEAVFMSGMYGFVTVFIMLCLVNIITPSLHKQIQGWRRATRSGLSRLPLREEAFSALNTNDFVIGPAEDGGYYLLGMRSLKAELFQNKNWGTSSVLKDTLSNLKNEKLHLLQQKNDIDRYEDIKGIEVFQQFLNASK